MEKRNSQLEHGQPMEQFQCSSVLHGQVSLAAVNQINVINEAMSGCKNLKIYKRLKLL